MFRRCWRSIYCMTRPCSINEQIMFAVLLMGPHMMCSKAYIQPYNIDRVLLGMCLSSWNLFRMTLNFIFWITNLKRTWVQRPFLTNNVVSISCARQQSSNCTFCFTFNDFRRSLDRNQWDGRMKYGCPLPWWSSARSWTNSLPLEDYWITCYGNANGSLPFLFIMHSAFLKFHNDCPLQDLKLTQIFSGVHGMHAGVHTPLCRNSFPMAKCVLVHTPNTYTIYIHQMRDNVSHHSMRCSTFGNWVNTESSCIKTRQ